MSDLREDLHFSVEEAFQEVLRRRREQGAYSEEEYDELVDEVLNEKLDHGELSDDDEVMEWKEQLQNRWQEVGQLDSESGTNQPEE
jgi:hypothetical protein